MNTVKVVCVCVCVCVGGGYGLGPSHHRSQLTQLIWVRVLMPSFLSLAVKKSSKSLKSILTCDVG